MSVFDSDTATLRAMARELGSSCVVAGTPFDGILAQDETLALDESGLAVRSRERILRVVAADVPAALVREATLTVAGRTYRVVGLPEDPDDDGYLHLRVVRA